MTSVFLSFVVLSHFLSVAAIVGGSKRGITPQQLALSEATLRKLAAACHANAVFLRKSTQEDGEVAFYLIRSRQEEEEFIEVRYTDTN